jgi:hypothetical protein
MNLGDGICGGAGSDLLSIQSMRLFKLILLQPGPGVPGEHVIHPITSSGDCIIRVNTPSNAFAYSVYHSARKCCALQCLVIS